MVIGKSWQKLNTETQGHRGHGSQFGEWAAEGSPTEGHRDPWTRDARRQCVSCSRIAVSFRRRSPGDIHAATTTPWTQLLCSLGVEALSIGAPL